MRLAGTKVEATTPTDWWLMGTKDYTCVNTKETGYNDVWHKFLTGPGEANSEFFLKQPYKYALARCCKNRTIMHYNVVTQKLTAVEDLSLHNLLDFSMYLKSPGELYGYFLTNNALYCYEFNGKQVKRKLWEIPVVLKKPSAYPFTVYFEGEPEKLISAPSPPKEDQKVNHLWHLKETEMDVDRLGAQWIKDFKASGMNAKNWSDSNTKNVSRCVYCALVDSATGDVVLGPDATSNAACNGSNTCQSEMTQWVNKNTKKIFRPKSLNSQGRWTGYNGGSAFDTSPTQQDGSGKRAVVHDCQDALPATLAVNEKFITIQGNELLVYASVNQSRPNQKPTKVELRSSYRGFSAMKDFQSFSSGNPPRKDPVSAARSLALFAACLTTSSPMTATSSLRRSGHSGQPPQQTSAR